MPANIRALARLLALLTAAAVALAGCNFPGFQSTPDAFATSAAATVAAQLTQSSLQLTLAAQSTPLPPTATSTPQASPTPAATLTPTEAPCTDKAAFVADVTIPDDTNLAPGASFKKTWRLRNAGTCTWTSEYALVFDSGNIMGGPASVNLPGPVAPNATVDLSVDLKAPTSNGTHRGNWKLRNDSGVIFGVGVNANVAFWVQITVGPTGQVVYDFYAKACDAVWQSGAGVLPCPGSDTDNEGFVLKLPSPKLENGTTENEPALETHPEWIDNGVISGRFPAFNVQAGDRFKAVIGCLFNGASCNVKFQVNYRSDGGALQPLGEWTEVYDGSTTKVDIDLSSLAGHSVEFSLAVLANGPSGQDWAFWLAPRITR
jgi:hypothetical protein